MNLRRVAMTIVGLLVAAVIVAVLWVWLSPTPQLIVDADGGMRFASESDPAKLFGGVAIFGLLTLALGAGIALVAWFGMASTRGAAGLLFVTLMSAATSVLALLLAQRLAEAIHGGVERSIPGTYRGTVNLWLDGGPGPSWSLLLCAPTAAVLIYLVCTVSSNHADLGIGDDRPVVVTGPAVDVPAEHTPADPSAADPSPADLTSGAATPRTHP